MLTFLIFGISTVFSDNNKNESNFDIIFLGVCLMSFVLSLLIAMIIYLC